jgi:hypothetical protein
MKRLLSTALLITLASSTSLRADIVIVQKVEGVGGQTGEMTMKMKNGMVRTDVNPEMSNITDTKTGDVITLLHDRKSYMKISGATTKAMLEQIRKMTQEKSGSSPASAPKLKATGRKEKISGYDTEEYVCDMNGKKMSYWIAKDFPNYSVILREMMQLREGGLSAMMKGLMPDASDFPGMPIRTEVDNGGEKIVTTLLSANQEPVDAADMQAPAAYKEMTMPNFTLPGTQGK